METRASARVSASKGVNNRSNGASRELSFATVPAGAKNSERIVHDPDAAAYTMKNVDKPLEGDRTTLILQFYTFMNKTIH